MTVSETLKKNWIFIVFGLIVIIPLMYVMISLVMTNYEPSYALIIEELNEGDVLENTNYWENGSLFTNYNPTTINLTEEDFKTFPKLAPIIRDKSQKSGDVGSNGRVTYQVYYWEDEHYPFVSHFGDGGYLEYKGKRYRFGFIHVD